MQDSLGAHQHLPQMFTPTLWFNLEERNGEVFPSALLRKQIPRLIAFQTETEHLSAKGCLAVLTCPSFCGSPKARGLILQRIVSGAHAGFGNSLLGCIQLRMQSGCLLVQPKVSIIELAVKTVMKMSYKCKMQLNIHKLHKPLTVYAHAILSL